MDCSGTEPEHPQWRYNGDYGHNNYNDYLHSLQSCTLISNNKTLLTCILNCDRYRVTQKTRTSQKPKKIEEIQEK